MGTLRALTINLPGTYGLNTTEDTALDEVLRYGSQVTNGVVDSGGKLKSREDFILQTTVGTSSKVESLYTHRNNDATETVLSASAGLISSGIATLTTRFSYAAGSQIVDVGGAKTGASATGLVNDATVYTATVTIDGTSNAITVTGTAGQTYTALLAEINADMTGATVSLVGGNLKIISGTTGASSSISIAPGTLFAAILTGFVAVRTASAGTVLNNSWQMASLSSKIYMAQAGQHFTALNETTFAVESVVGQPWTSSPNCVIAAYGRAWAADDAAGGNRHTIWWSNLLDGKVWNSGDAGSINLANAWPKGQDSIVAVVAAFDRLLVLGRHTILLYTLGADNDPASMTLDDTIENVGCVSRDSVMTTDNGVYFLSDNGIMRIDRLAQVTSQLTLPDMSKLFAKDVVDLIAAETATLIRAGYYPKEGWYLLSFPTSNITLCMHTRKIVPGEGLTVPITTKWTNAGRPLYAFTYDAAGVLYSGGVNGIHKYSGYTPDGTSNAYNLVFYTQWHNFLDESRLKHLKGVSLVLNAASGQTGTLFWLTDFLAGTSNSQTFTCDAVEFAENPGIGTVRMNIGRSCSVAQFGVSFPIAGGKPVTLHQLRALALPGAIKL